MKQNCNQELEARIELWSHTGNKNLIGDFHEKFEDKYVQNLNGWDKDNYPYPKKFDVKIYVINNLLAYEQDTPRKLNDYTLDVTLRLNVGQSSDALYSLNSHIYENIEIIKEKTITNSDFKNKEFYLTLLEKDIPFEQFYKKYESKGCFINQFVFEIIFRSKNNEKLCSYEYVFPMSERGE
jgi:hypothetical protein